MEPPQAQSESDIVADNQASTSISTDFKVYKPSSESQRVDLPVLTDEYFTPTAADLKAAQASLSARTQALVNAPLLLRAARDDIERAKRDRWPTTKIRVRFPDRTQLEKTFPSTDKIRAVYAFVRECLREDVKPIKFILYQSPPKRDLKVSDPKVRGLSLVELQLAPSSILLLRFEDESLNHINITAPLTQSVLSMAVDLPTPPSASSDTSSSNAAGSTPTQTTPPREAGSSATKKIPKWLKFGQKK